MENSAHLFLFSEVSLRSTESTVPSSPQLRKTWGLSGSRASWEWGRNRGSVKISVSGGGGAYTCSMPNLCFGAGGGEQGHIIPGKLY